MTESMLAAAAMDAAREFIEANARPLEVARYLCYFEGSPRDAVLDALAAFQNADGGFGRALEPDLRTDDSSVLCTTLAFQVLRAVKAAPDADMVERAIGFLLETFDGDEGHFRIIPLSAAGSPHAPWWTQAGREEGFDAFSLNPTAEVLGYLYDYRPLVPGDVISQVEGRVVGRLGEADEIEMHELMCCLRLLATPSLPDGVRALLYGALSRVIGDTVARDPAEWAGYSLRPLQVVDGPDSPFMAGLEEAVAANLDYEMASQGEDGSWAPTWDWGDAFPDVWAEAQREWSGFITLDKLLTLRRFGRIEGVG